MPFAKGHLLNLLALLLAALTMAACSTVAPEPIVHQTKPGYVCSVGKRFEHGAWASASVTSDGEPHGISWEWRRGLADSALLRATVSGFEKETISPDPGSAFGSIAWAFYIPDRGRRDLYRLELTTVPDTHLWRTAPFASDFSRHGDIYIMTAWPELLAFAKGAQDLTVIVRGTDGSIERRATIDANAIIGATAELDEALAKVREMVADYRSRCTATEDLEPSIILV